MPNHITNHLRIQASKELESEILNAIKGSEKNQHIDFEKIIPQVDVMPPPEGQMGYTLEDERRAKANGQLTSLDFNRKYWGTKWNAYDQVLTDDGIKFDTAWSCPVPIFEAMAKRWPDAVFRVDYADEDTGHNCGILVFHNDKVEEYDPYYPAAFALALRDKLYYAMINDLDEGCTDSSWSI